MYPRLAKQEVATPRYSIALSWDLGTLWEAIPLGLGSLRLLVYRYAVAQPALKLLPSVRSMGARALPMRCVKPWNVVAIVWALHDGAFEPRNIRLRSKLRCAANKQLTCYQDTADNGCRGHNRTSSHVSPTVTVSYCHKCARLPSRLQRRDGLAKNVRYDLDLVVDFSLISVPAGPQYLPEPHISRFYGNRPSFRTNHVRSYCLVGGS